MSDLQRAWFQVTAFPGAPARVKFPNRQVTEDDPLL
jgi:hypothetical protein